MRQTTHTRYINALLALSIFFLSCSAIAGSPTKKETKSQITSAPKAKPAWWQQAIFYEVFVRSFADSHKGPLADDGIGDLQGLIEKLDYLNDGKSETTQDLGINAIWLMPIMQSPSYHGYDTTDYYKVNSDYGSNADFKRLIVEAHKRGIRVILDLVLNHGSIYHPTFEQAKDKESHYRDWFVWSKNPTPTIGSYGNDAWHKLDDEYYYGYFSANMPDWNYRNPAVTQEMYEVTRFWAQTMGADGFRLDAIRYLIEDGSTIADSDATHAWLKAYHQFYKNIDPDLFTVGEVWAETATTASYPPSELETTFQFELAEAIIKSVNIGARLKLDKLLDNISERFPTGQFASFLTNHDQARVMTILGSDVPRAKLAASLLLTLPGVPFIYYGEEIGMTGRKPDPDIRKPMQWSADENAGFTGTYPWATINDDYRTINVANESPDNASLLSYYRKWVRLRQQHPALSYGDYKTIPVDGKKLMAYQRQTADETVVVLINLGSQAVDKYALDYAKSFAGSKEIAQGETIKITKASKQKPQQPIARLEPRTAYIIALPRQVAK